MKHYMHLLAGVLVSFSLVLLMVSSPQAQTREEKQFMKEHSQEMTVFMEKCSKCHGLERVLAKKKPMAEWDNVLKIMAGKPHANLSENDLRQISKWIDFMQSAAIAGP